MITDPRTTPEGNNIWIKELPECFQIVENKDGEHVMHSCYSYEKWSSQSKNVAKLRAESFLNGYLYAQIGK